LYCIGRAYKITPWSIAKENGIWWPYIIFPSQKLRIPNQVWSPIPSGPICTAQFTPGSTPTPTPSATPVTPGPTPTVAPPTATVKPPTATPQPPSGCRTTYIVQRGDNLFRIALRFGTTYEVLARVNGIANPRLIYVGQQLCIP
jgi:LysM repeat protein